MPENTFNVGIDAKIVLVGPNGRIDLSHVTEWQSKQITKDIKVKPLNSPPINRILPEGWEFSFKISRANSAADDLINEIERNYWNGLAPATYKLYAYYKELNSSETTFEFTGIALKMGNAGQWEQEKAVEQTIEGFASLRNKLV